MNHVMPVAVYLATKFWMYFTWFFYLMPCILLPASLVTPNPPGLVSVGTEPVDSGSALL